MAVFEDVTIQWQGSDYTIEANNVMRAIAKVEDTISIGELFADNPKLTKVADAYSIALKQAGALVGSDEIYASLFGTDDNGVKGAILGLIMLMVPPEKFRTVRANEDAIEAEKKPTTGKTA